MTDLHHWSRRIENKLDRIDDKLDAHLDRLSKAEEAIHWIRGHIKFVLTLAITIVSVLITAIVELWAR